MKSKKQNIEKQKILILDSGTLITLSMNGLTYVLENFKKKEKINTKFIITKQVKKEVVDRPLGIRRFKLGALKIKDLINKKILELPSSIGIKEGEIEKITKKVMHTANGIFYDKKRPIHIIDYGEASILALSKILTEKGIDNVIAVDERTTRVLSEKPHNLKKIFEKKLHTKIKENKTKYDFFKDIKFVRSSEIVYVAWKKNLINIENGKDTILDALLYATKYKGCSITNEEINEIKRLG